LTAGIRHYFGIISPTLCFLLFPNCHQQCQGYQNSTVLEPRKIPTGLEKGYQCGLLPAFFSGIGEN